MDSIAHYRIVSKLGQGAMGEVYRATDTKLGRDVAIKLISPELAQDPDRLASFTREAQVLAALNHPNIAAIYGVEDHALVMELVEGPTLADRIRQGPIPLDEAIPIARQIADGLAAAHDRGIVHRDLKPANIKLAPDGTVKLLDFGLAKAAAVAAISQDEAATVALSMAGAEAIVGTPGYMAPEQARGLPLDKRADIWAFGVVLYEMLTGTRLFRGDTITDVMAAVLREEPDFTRVPASVRPVLRRCLERDPKRRLRDAGDAVLLLDEWADAPVGETRPRGLRAWLPWAAAAAALAAFLVVLTLHLRETPPELNTVRFRVALPPEVTLTQTNPFAVSPDGRMVAFPAFGPDGTNRLWLQEFAAAQPRSLPSTSIAAIPTVLTWHPSGDAIFYSMGRRLMRVDVDGGPPAAVMELPQPVFGLVVHDDGTMLYGGSSGIVRVDATGGAATQLTRADADRPHAVHELLPDGRHFLYSKSAPPGERAVYVGTIDAAPEDQPDRALLTTDFGALFAPGRSSTSGDLLIVREGTLVAQPFDPGTQRLAGDPATVTDNVFTLSTGGFGRAFYSVSRQGTLVYRSGTTSEGLSRQLAWIGRDGRMQTIYAELARINQVKLSPDATKAVTSRTDLESGGNVADLWITDLDTEAGTKFTFGGGVNAQPVWSRDGRSIAWARIREGRIALYRKPADGSGGEELLVELGEFRVINVSDWTADGQYLIYAYDSDVFALPVGEGTDANRKPIPIAVTPAQEAGAAVSPDGRWIAYISNETGRQEIYVQPFTPVARADGQPPVGPKWLVSRGTLGLARWGQNGDELVFLNADGALVSVGVTSTPTFKAGAPDVLFQMPRAFLVQAGNPGALADAARDLQRLILAIPSEVSRRQELSVVLNWDRP